MQKINANTENTANTPSAYFVASRRSYPSAQTDKAPAGYRPPGVLDKPDAVQGPARPLFAPLRASHPAPPHHNPALARPPRSATPAVHGLDHRLPGPQDRAASISPALHGLVAAKSVQSRPSGESAPSLAMQDERHRRRRRDTRTLRQKDWQPPAVMRAFPCWREMARTMRRPSTEGASRTASRGVAVNLSGRADSRANPVAPVPRPPFALEFPCPHLPPPLCSPRP